MKYPLKKTLQDVPFPDLAHIFSLLCLFLLALALSVPREAHASEDSNQMGHLYKLYMNEPTEVLYKRGNGFLGKNDLDAAMVCFTIVGNRYSPKMTKEEKHICAFALNNAGGIAQIRFNFSSAFSYFKKAMQVAETPIYQSYNNIAGIYLFFKDYGNARNYLAQAFEVGLEQKDWVALNNSLQNIMYLNWCVDSVGESSTYIKRYMRAQGMPHDIQYRSISTIGQGMLALARGNRLEALRHFLHYEEQIKSLQIVHDEDAKSLQIVHDEDANSVHLYIASTYMQEGNYQKALEFLRQTETNARAGGITDLLMQVYEYQMKCYRLMGNAEQERHVKSVLMNLKDSINTAEEFGKIKNIEFFHEVDKYEKQVVKLNHDKNTRSIVALICIVVLVVVAMFLYVVVVQNRRLSKSNSDLFHRNEELVRLADSEKLLRKNYTKKLEGYVKRVVDLEGQLSRSTPEELLITQQAASTDKEGVGKPHGNTVSDESRIALMDRIYEQMDDVDFICQQDLTIERLAQAVGSNEKYVSQVINELMNKNFNTLLNEYRIREICKRLTDFAHYGNMTNETIAEGVGFKSRSHFIRTFKKMTGLTPSQYQKIAKSEGVKTMSS